MTLREAQTFLAKTEIDNKQPSAWADLGCGSGLFSQVLSSRLCDGSVVYAIDKSIRQNITPVNKEVKIITSIADFEKDNLPLPRLHGILMANSIHYVKDKPALLYRLKEHLLPGGVFIIIEYDITTGNRWVPYPLSFVQLQQLFLSEGFTNIQKTGERKSVYQRGNMYVALIKES